MNVVTRSATAVIALLIGLSGCNLSSIDTKLYPGPDLPKNEIAQLSVMPFNQGWTEYEYNIGIDKIYGPVPGRRLTFPQEAGRNYLLLPGSYKLYIRLWLIGNNGSITDDATVELTFQAEAGCAYQVMYEKLKEKAGRPDLVWIEDIQTKRVVSEKVRFPERQ